MNAMIVACICSGLFSILVSKPMIEQNKIDGIDMMWPYTLPIAIFLAVFVVAQYFFSDNFIREFKNNLDENKRKREERISKAIDDKYSAYFNSLPDFKEQYKNHSINLPTPKRDSYGHIRTLVRYIIIYTWTMGIAGYMVLDPNADIYNYISAAALIILNIGFTVVTFSYVSNVVNSAFIEGINKDHILMSKYYKDMSEAVVEECEEEIKKRKESDGSST